MLTEVIIILLIFTIWIAMHNGPYEYLYLYPHPLHRFTRLLYTLYEWLPGHICRRRLIYRCIYIDRDVTYLASDRFMHICKYMTDNSLTKSTTQIRSVGFIEPFIDRPWRTVVYSHKCKFAFPPSSWIKSERYSYIDIYAKSTDDIDTAINNMYVATKKYEKPTPVITAATSAYII